MFLETGRTRAGFGQVLLGFLPIRFPSAAPPSTLPYSSRFLRAYLRAREAARHEGPPALAEPDPEGAPRGRAPRAPDRRPRRRRHRRGHHPRQRRGQHSQVRARHFPPCLSPPPPPSQSRISFRVWRQYGWTDGGFLVFLSLSARRGHGTSDQDGEVVATLCGVVERVNKLVYVRTLRARYSSSNLPRIH